MGYLADMSAAWGKPVNRLVPLWLSAGLLLTVFFLPLHIHSGSAVASQVTKECICLHGSRTQTGLASAPPAGAMLIALGEAPPPVQFGCASFSPPHPCSRAPPPSVSS